MSASRNYANINLVLINIWVIVIFHQILMYVSLVYPRP